MFPIMDYGGFNVYNREFGVIRACAAYLQSIARLFSGGHRCLRHKPKIDSRTLTGLARDKRLLKYICLEDRKFAAYATSIN